MSRSTVNRQQSELLDRPRCPGRHGAGQLDEGAEVGWLTEVAPLGGVLSNAILAGGGMLIWPVIDRSNQRWIEPAGRDSASCPVR